MKIIFRKALFIFLLGFFSLHAMVAQSARQPWSAWVQELRSEALAQGIPGQLFDGIFRATFTPNKKLLRLDRRQPERRLTFLKYRNTRADNYRIRLGRKKYRKHRRLLEKVGQEFGVDPCIITSIWGMESSYGHYLGNFDVIRSLATLAYDRRRSAFFRKELLIALHILHEGHVVYRNFKGEWAGASGQAQFLPSSWRRFAVDYDQDGRKDIWKSYPDAFASIANYLVQNGWERGQPWAIAVELPYNFDQQLIKEKAEKTVEEWKKLGVRLYGTYKWPEQFLPASIITPLGGPSLLVFNNFQVLLRYNRSNFYAGTIGYMAEKICRKR